MAVKIRSLLESLLLKVIVKLGDVEQCRLRRTCTFFDEFIEKNRHEIANEGLKKNREIFLQLVTHGRGFAFLVNADKFIYDPPKELSAIGFPCLEIVLEDDEPLEHEVQLRYLSDTLKKMKLSVYKLMFTSGSRYRISEKELSLSNEVNYIQIDIQFHDSGFPYSSIFGNWTPKSCEYLTVSNKWDVFPKKRFIDMTRNFKNIILIFNSQQKALGIEVFFGTFKQFLESNEDEQLPEITIRWSSFDRQMENVMASLPEMKLVYQNTTERSNQGHVFQRMDIYALPLESQILVLRAEENCFGIECLQIMTFAIIEKSKKALIKILDKYCKEKPSESHLNIIYDSIVSVK